MSRSDIARGILALGVFGATVWLEHRHALRRPAKEPKLRRMIRNTAIASATGIASQVAARPVLVPLAQSVERRRVGMLQRLRLPVWLEALLGVIVLDYGFYVWHILLHRVPLLWRSHVVHHADLDLDASTAVRFHFTEILATIPFLSAVVRVAGIRPRTLTIWQTGLAASVVFHHSNIRLPVRVERLLSRLLVTPRLHGIHHSIVPEETHSNYSSGLAAWDFLHRTRRADVPQDEITIGVPAYLDRRQVTFPRMMALPFERQPDAWRLPDGRIPHRD
jgi:sterol desaturase/sphingolipid hydroxylase (fatty acid hydroxylase superfamily)